MYGSKWEDGNKRKDDSFVTIEDWGSFFLYLKEADFSTPKKFKATILKYHMDYWFRYVDEDSVEKNFEHLGELHRCLLSTGSVAVTV